MSVPIPNKFDSFRDYHSSRVIKRADHLDWPSIRATVLSEASGEAVFKSNDRHSLVLAAQGSRKHFTRMEGVHDEAQNNPGDVCLVPAHIEVHLGWENHGLEQETQMLDFDDGLFSLYAPEVVTADFLSGHLTPCGYARRPELEGLIRILTREVVAPVRRGRAFTDCAIHVLAQEIAATVWSTPGKAIRTGTGRDPRIHRAIEYIEAHFTNDISLLDVSSTSGLSLTQLKDGFRRHTGSTPYSYIIDRRLAHAITLLRSTDIPLAQVAIDSGFADQQHMTRLFKARHDRTPGQVRNG